MAKIIGTVKSISGKASVTRGGNEVHPLKAGEVLHENDIIQTLQAGAKVVLMLEGGRELTLNGNDQILLDESVFAVLEEGEVIDGKALHQLIADKFGNPAETAAGDTTTSEANAGAEYASRNDARGSTDSSGTFMDDESSALGVNFNAIQNENFQPVVSDVSEITAETDGIQTFSGELEVFDPDNVPGSHIFQQTGDATVVASNEVVQVTDFSVEVDPDGAYRVNGNFDALAAGETATVTFTYTATDNSGADNATSEAKTVTLMVMGTNDQPVVSDINVNGTGSASFVGLNELTTVQGESIYLNGSRNWGQAFVAEDSSLSKIQLNMYDTTNNNMDAQARIVIMSSDNFINDSQTIWQPTIFSGPIVYEETISLIFGTDHIVTVDTNNLELTLGEQYYIVVYPVSGDTFNIYLSQAGTTGDGVALTEINDPQSGSGYIHGTYNLGIALTYGNGETVFSETSNTQTISPEYTLLELSGLTDLDTSDTHTFQLAADTLPVVTTSSEATVTDLQVVITDENTGAYSISGNFDALAEGEIATVTFQYVANDGKGFDGTDGINESSISAPKTVTLTVTGTNDAPTINAEVSNGSITEASSTVDLVATNTFAFADLDTTDTHTVTSAFKSGTYTDLHGNAVTQSAVGSITSLTVSDNATGDNAGQVTWEYTVNDAALQYLAEGETVELVYTVTLSDNHGGSVNKDIAITITGTNDQPIVSDVNVNGIGMTGEVTYTNDTDFPVYDYHTTLSTIEITDSGSIQDLNVQINLAHSWDGDLKISLIAPDGKVIVLSAYHGGSGDSYSNTVFDDEAITAITSGSAPFNGVYRPEGLLSAIDGLEMQGIWTLQISDDAGADSGVLYSWSLIIDSNGTTTIYESNDIETIYTGQLELTSDLDISDTHTFQQFSTPSVETSSGALITDLGVTVAANGGYTINGNFDALAEGETATVTFQYVANDGKGFDGTDGINESSISAPKTITLIVTGTNDAPVAISSDTTATEDTIINGNVSATDMDKGETSTLTYSLVDPAPVGLTFNTNGSYSFDANSYDYLSKDETQELKIAFTATDIHNATSSVAYLTITITGTNDAPIAVNDEVTESYTVSSINYGGSNGWNGVTITPIGGALYNNNGQLGVRFNLLDDRSIDNSTPGTDEAIQLKFTNLLQHAEINLGGFNTQLIDLPVAGRDTVVWTAMMGATVIASGIYTGGDDSILVIDTGVRVFDTLIIGTPAGSGSDFYIDSIQGYSVDINSALTLMKNTALTIEESYLIDNDTDIDHNDILNITAINSTGTIGEVHLDTDGNVIYDPVGRFDHLAAGEIAHDTFTYTLSDGIEESTATVTVNIIGSDSANDGSVTMLASSLSNYDGGDGYDSVTLTSIFGQTLDFDDISSKLHNIEHLDFNSLIGKMTINDITPDNVANMTDSDHVLKISGEADDTLQLSGFTKDEAASANLEGYNIYSGTSTGGAEITLHIDQDITHIIP